MEASLHSFATSTLSAGEWSTSCTGRFTSGANRPHYPCNRKRWVGGDPAQCRLHKDLLLLRGIEPRFLACKLYVKLYHRHIYSTHVYAIFVRVEMYKYFNGTRGLALHFTNVHRIRMKMRTYVPINTVTLHTLTKK